MEALDRKGFPSRHDSSQRIGLQARLHTENCYVTVRPIVKEPSIWSSPSFSRLIALLRLRSRTPPRRFQLTRNGFPVTVVTERGTKRVLTDLLTTRETGGKVKRVSPFRSDTLQWTGTESNRRLLESPSKRFSSVSSWRLEIPNDCSHTASVTDNG